ncbi:hypothetical protein [Streptomyces sp. NPDC018833]|uniref:hypothetical protein n=1 Tax=Streptomyces sp. NPDC018833 TaxID=3365053 RepID=UPI0037996BFF
MPAVEPATDPYRIQACYAVTDDAWYLELWEAGAHLLTAIVPDEDPRREPTVCFNEQAGHRDIPYDVVRRFMERVADEVERCRGWMRLAPGLVEIIRQLYVVFSGCLDDEEIPPLLVVLRELVDEESLGTVVEAAFGTGLADLAADAGSASPEEVRALKERMAEDGWTIR